MSKLFEKLANTYNSYYVKYKCNEEEIDRILKFYTDYDGYRTDYMCSQVTGYEEEKCKRIHMMLGSNRPHIVP